MVRSSLRCALAAAGLIVLLLPAGASATVFSAPRIGAPLVTPTLGSDPETLTPAAGRTWFSAGLSGRGREPAVTDGTTAGTTVVADLEPGSGSSLPDQFVGLGSTALFAATTTATGRELFRSTGTAAGTGVVVDLVAGSGSSTPSDLTVVGSGAAARLFFVAQDPVLGQRVLWRTDGTAGATTRVLDDQGDPLPGVTRLAAVGTTLAFTRTTPGTGAELWTAGLTGPAALAVDVEPGATGSDPSAYTTMNGSLFFLATVSGARTLFRFAAPSTATPITEVGGGELVATPTQLFFVGPAAGGGGLWRSDGSTAELVFDAAAHSGTPHRLTPMGSRVALLTGEQFFLRLIVSDGRPAGTTDLGAAFPGGTPPLFIGPLAATADRLFFAAFDQDEVPAFGDTYRQLYTTDGTVGGTKALPTTENPGLDAYAASGPVLFFSGAVDGSDGAELWRTDGTAAGTRLLADLDRTPAPNYTTPPVRLGDRLVLLAGDGRYGVEPRVIDPAAATMSVLRDVHLGSESSAWYSPLVRAGSQAYFIATSSIFDRDELYATDGTPAGTRRVVDFPANAPGVIGLAAFGDRALFTASDDLWVTDGTQAGTTQLDVPDEARPGGAFGDLGGGRAVFAATSAATGSELHVTDGTPAGTRRLTDLMPGPTSGTFGGFAVLGDRAIFPGTDPVHGAAEPWVTDGTPEGTRNLVDLGPGTASGQSNAPLVAGGRAWIVTFQQGRGQMWVSDATPEGTRLTADFGPPVPGVSILPGQPAGLPDGTVVFAAGDVEAGRELWRTDGTPEGTSRLADVRPGPASSLPASPVSVRDQVVFIADDGVHGSELWRTDGTAAGTAMVADLAQGPRSGVSSTALTADGDAVWFIGDDGTGPGLWRVDAGDDPPVPVAVAEPPVLAPPPPLPPAPVTPAVRRAAPRAVTLAASGRLSSRPTFRLSGRVTPPLGVPRAAGCRGTVAVSVRRGRTTLVTGTARVGTRCAYATTLRLRRRGGLTTRSRLTATARFAGNAAVLPRSARPASLRFR